MIVVATTESDVARVQERLGVLGCRATHVTSPGGTRRLVLGTIDDEHDAHRVVATLRAGGDLAIVRPDGGPRLAGWQRHTTPLRLGDRLSICFAWSEHDRAGAPGLVELGAGGFGNGDHPATRLLLDELLDRVRGGERVLDVGCGSGVLGLSALRLGAAQLVATDVDPAAVAATRRNAALNDMEREVTATADPLEAVDGVFDIVVANIGRGVIADLASRLVAHVAPGGWLAVSGFSPAQATSVAGFLGPLVEQRRAVAAEWSSVVLAHAPCQPATPR